MGKPILLLRLEGPLQSWGVRSRWDVRDTGLEPTKSGVIGLLGCALGYPMRDPRLEELSDGLRFGVRVENPGAIVTDYQTITGYLPIAGGGYRFRGGTGGGPPPKLEAEGKAPATIISPRAYLEDAAFLVALEAKADTEVLQSCAEALQRPKWPLFLGRKSCIPTRPVFEYFGSEYSDISDVFKRYPWQWLGASGRQRQVPHDKQLQAFIDDESGELTRQDVIRTNATRTYGFRAVRREFFAPILSPEVA